MYLIETVKGAEIGEEIVGAESVIVGIGAGAEAEIGIGIEEGSIGIEIMIMTGIEITAEKEIATDTDNIIC